MKGLLGIGHPGSQANHLGDAFQGEDCFGAQGGKGGQQGWDGNLARRALEKTRSAGEGLGGHLIEAVANVVEEVLEHEIGSGG